MIYRETNGFLNQPKLFLPLSHTLMSPLAHTLLSPCAHSPPIHLFKLGTLDALDSSFSSGCSGLVGATFGTPADVIDIIIISPKVKHLLLCITLPSSMKLQSWRKNIEQHRQSSVKP